MPLFGKKKKEEPQPRYGAIYRFEGISSQKQLQLTEANKKLRVLIGAFFAKQLTDDQLKEQFYNTLVQFVPREDLLSDNQVISQYLDNTEGLPSSQALKFSTTMMLTINRIRGL